MNATPTRTYNPLPFTDLEPKRFEDLVRQLIYEFRPWRRLEATGRSGSDDGFDARALEIVDAVNATPAVDQDETEDEAAEPGIPDRLWLIQCKRERKITPAKLKGYLTEIRLGPEEKLHGIIFAAASDFSKAARDAFYAWCRDQGLSEALIWGKGELEDQLYQPKNDNLLFAYFGISLTIRRRSQATQIRAEIATKRKLKKTVMSSSADVLVRDPLAEEYPHVKEGERPTKWGVFAPETLSHNGLEMSISWSYAFLDPDTGEWDAADGVPAMRRHHHWRVEDTQLDELDYVARATWDALPEENRAWLKFSGGIRLRDIVAIDDLGDDLFEGVHIYAPFSPMNGPFSCFWRWLELSPYSKRHDVPKLFHNDPSKRIDRFHARTKKTIA
ncbi:restriction endonuclease [Bradyrhizobium yuanmingense]|uniref:Restriction endonuclease type IV Mrr domain-containing protein n=1 Tax=Bradyrhizobium yuanmingense TaxID=108015 RepID=A0ABV4GJE3_9BRAD|nr:restriction endonuclease [Bradyrhizobium yuanmingense]